MAQNKKTAKLDAKKHPLRYLIEEEDLPSNLIESIRKARPASLNKLKERLIQEFFTWHKELETRRRKRS